MKGCAVCAWRRNCQVKFSLVGGMASHCIHFTSDLEIQEPGESSETADVVICGCGVGGLSLALLLAEKGYQVILLDRGKGVLPVQKPEVLQPEALAFLKEHGVLSRLLALGPSRWEESHFYHAGGRCLLTTKCGKEESSHGLITFARWTNQALLDTLTGYSNVRIMWGAEVMDLLRRRDSVTGVRAQIQGEARHIFAPIVVGADGVASRVRTALGIPCQVHQYPDAFVTMIVDRPAVVGDGVHYYLGRRSFLGLFPISSDVLCLLLSVKADGFFPLTARMLETLKKQVAAMAPPVAEAMSEITTRERVNYLPCMCVAVSRWVSDGVALMGDSAHACHPYMAMGSAQAIEDAKVLACVLDACFRRGDFSADLLAPYEAKRRPAVERLQSLADRRVLLWNARNPLLAWARNGIIRSVARHPQLLSREFIANTVGMAR